MNRKIVFVSLMTALASVLFIVENMVPLPLPWLRLGLANAVTLLALHWWGAREGFLITILRVCIGGFLSGRFLQPLFWMALAGGIGSAAGMWLLLKCKNRFSLTGVSVFGAVIKNAAQLALAWLLTGRQAGIITLLPLLLISAVFSGILIGLVAVWVDARVGGSVGQGT